MSVLMTREQIKELEKLENTYGKKNVKYKYYKEGMYGMSVYSKKINRTYAMPVGKNGRCGAINATLDKWTTTSSLASEVFEIIFERENKD